ncbi:unnamed protein product [Clonostachys rosea f. rosea IK726]|uniref:Uncharacterized protein n=1 Tax=Clonostachys rosea f. rosea IK726 TaxID=1349383 RepID=A0ACA9TXD2_BIOOC|nr:unnamed protein product [Clonostachys rosea f. rosea IK726]
MAPGEPEPVLKTHHPVLAPRPTVHGASSPRPRAALGFQQGGIAQRYEGHKGGSRVITRVRIACQHCRQSKLRCEGSFGGSHPCQRCSELRRPCVFDNKLRRVSKKATLSDIADQVNLLKTFSALPPNDATLTAVPVSSSLPQQRTAVNLTSVGNQQLLDGCQRPLPGGDLDSDRFRERERSRSNTSASNYGELPAQSLHGPSSSRNLESVELTADEVESYFEIFHTSYHPIFPILSSSVSPDSIYDSSPLLFWTIIVTAARHDAADFSLLLSLLPAVRKLLWSTIPATPHTLPSLQAMAILCLWGFPVSTMPEDTTFILSGILQSAALHVGLHRPDILELYSRTRSTLGRPELLQAVRCWCSIYLAIEGASIGNGHPPGLANDHTVEKASIESNPYELPESLHMAIVTQLFCDKIHVAFGKNNTFKISLINDHESRLRELETRLGSFKSRSASIHFLAASFQLKSYSLFDDEDSVERRLVVLRAFDLGVQYIEALRQGEKDGFPSRYAPFMTLRVCLSAAVFISKVLHSSYGQFVDQRVGKAAFSACIPFFKQSSVEDNDMAGRTTTILSQLWVIHKDLFEASPDTPPPRLSVKSRSFASIAHDGLWQWRERYAGTPSNGAPSIPPPLISPVSMAVDNSPLAVGRPGTSPTGNAEPSDFSNLTGQDEGGFTDINAIYVDSQQQETIHQQEPSPGLSLAGEPELGSWADMSGNDDALTGIDFVDQDAMHFDLLFPNYIMDSNTSIE